MNETQTQKYNNISSNKTIQVHKDSIFGLVQDTEICETTRKILHQNQKLDSQIIIEYHYLADSLHYLLEFKTTGVNRLSNKLVLPKLNANIQPPQIKSVKQAILKPELKAVPKKKRRLRNLFNRK